MESIRFVSPLRGALAFAILLTIGLACSALAATTPQLSGVISDTLGRPLARANLELRDVKGGLVGSSTTDQSGKFTIALTKSGVYSLMATRSGFKPATKIVSVAQSADQTVSISMAANEALTVPVQASAIRGQNTVSFSGANKYTMTDKDIADLPR